VYGYAPGQGRQYDFGDRKVDFFAHGYDALINFGFKDDARGSLDSLFARYSASLHGPLDGVALLNYVSSHDDGGPYDVDRKDPLGAGTRLLLAPGGAQIYYGDELARPLVVKGAAGDANLRSMMNWGDLVPGSRAASTLEHWRKLGRFRRNHPAVGAGVHRTLQASPLIFSRTLSTDTVLVALDQPEGQKVISVSGLFSDGSRLLDEYSGASGTVAGGTLRLTTPFPLALLSRAH
jgi:alpha-amylase